MSVLKVARVGGDRGGLGVNNREGLLSAAHCVTGRTPKGPRLSGRVPVSMYDVQVSITDSGER